MDKRPFIFEHEFSSYPLQCASPNHPLKLYGLNQYWFWNHWQFFVLPKWYVMPNDSTRWCSSTARFAFNGNVFIFKTIKPLLYTNNTHRTVNCHWKPFDFVNGFDLRIVRCYIKCNAVLLANSDRYTVYIRVNTSLISLY